MRPLFLIVTIVVLGALGQLSMKKGMASVGSISLTLSTVVVSVTRMLTSPFVLLGLFLYAISAIFWLTVLSRVDLSYAYPMISIGYVLVMALSWIFLNERFAFIRILGVALICGGVFLISRS